MLLARIPHQEANRAAEPIPYVSHPFAALRRAISSVP